MGMRHFLNLILGALFFAATLLAGAQTQTGSIHGTITDPTGAVIPSSTVTVTGDGGLTTTVTSGANGAYALQQVAPGHYTVSASAQGFAASAPQNVTVSAG